MLKFENKKREMFTTKDILKRVDYPNKIKIQLLLGKRLISSYRSMFNSNPEKTKEDGFEVFAYPETFRKKALKIRNKFINQYNLKLKTRKRKVYEQR